MRRSFWVTRFGFYLAAVGSAFGLGNLWRFPYVVVENGGGAFVLLYVLLAFLIGLPILLAELLVGKSQQTSVVVALKQIAKLKPGEPNSALAPVMSKVASFAGRLSMLVCILVLAYYAVVSGWVLHFLMQFAIGPLASGNPEPQTVLEGLMSSAWLQISLASVHLLIATIIILKGFEEGFERSIGYMMSVFAVLLIVLVAKSLSLPTSVEALRFLFYPDFSRLSLSSFGHALGHVFFTLSLGFGTMVTFGSYMKPESQLDEVSFRVTTMDTFISLFAGLLIFPIFIASPFKVSGPEALFQTVPAFFQQIENGQIYGLGFFLCLYLAALGATIGLMESVVANLVDRLHISRAKASLLAGVGCFLISVFPALATTVFEGIAFQGKNLLLIFDSIIINWILPLAALGLCLVVAYRLDTKVQQAEFYDPVQMNSIRIYHHWIFVLKWLAPAVIVLALFTQALHILIRIF